MGNEVTTNLSKKTSKYLAWIIYYITFFGLLGIWGAISESKFNNSDTWRGLLQSLIPNVLSPLVIFGILYLLFFRKRINIEKVLRGEQSNWFEAGYESYDDINWEPYLSNSKRLVIVAFFFEDWIRHNSVYFEEFLRNEDSTLIIYLPDYTDLTLLSKINALIPEHSQNELSTKVQNSIAEIKNRTASMTQRVSVSLYNKPFNYTYQLFDKKMLLSFNVLNRAGNYKSPFIVLNLELSKNLHKFFSHETLALEASSKKINLSQWIPWTTEP